MPISWVEVLEVLWMLDAQVLVCLSVGLKCRKFCRESCANTLYVSTIIPHTSWLHRYLVCISIGLKCWKFWRGSVV